MHFVKSFCTDCGGAGAKTDQQQPTRPGYHSCQRQACQPSGGGRGAGVGRFHLGGRQTSRR